MVNHDANSSIRSTIPVCKKAITVCQAVCCDGDQACWLIRKACVELATWINKLLKLPIPPNLQLCCQNLHIWIRSIDISKIYQFITRNIHFLSRLEHSILLNLKKVRTDDSYSEHDQSQMYQIASITLPVALEKHIQSEKVRLSMMVSHTYPAPHFV